MTKTHRSALLGAVALALAALACVLPAAAQTLPPADTATDSDTDTSVPPPVPAPFLSAVSGDDEMAPMTSGQAGAATGTDTPALAVEPARAPKPMTQALALSVGGALSVTFERSFPKDRDGDKVEGLGGGVLAVAPQVGFFVIDNLELQLALDIQVPFGKLYDSIPYSKTRTGFEVGARYLFDVGPLFLYVGGRLGFATEKNEILGYKLNEKTQLCANDANGLPIRGRETYEDKFLTLGVPLGVLFPLNAYVALDAGLQFDLDLSVTKDGTSYFRNPWGFFGVAGFFELFGS